MSPSSIRRYCQETNPAKTAETSIKVTFYAPVVPGLLGWQEQHEQVEEHRRQRRPVPEIADGNHAEMARLSIAPLERAVGNADPQEDRPKQVVNIGDGEQQ